MNWLTCKIGNKISLLKSLPFVIMAWGSWVWADTTIESPVGEKNFPDLIKRITYNLIPVATVFAVAALVFAGFKFITASLSGNEAELKKARQIFWWILIGIAIVVGAWALASAVANFAKNL